MANALNRRKQPTTTKKCKRETKLKPTNVKHFEIFYADEEGTKRDPQQKKHKNDNFHVQLRRRHVINVEMEQICVTHTHSDSQLRRHNII